MSERREYRATYTVLRVDPVFLSLSKDAKLYWHTAKLELPVSGIGVCLPHTIAGLASLTVEEARAAERELEAAGWVRRDGAVLWLVNGLRHTPNLSSNDSKHRKHIAVLMANLPRENPLVSAFREHYAEWFVSAKAQLTTSEWASGGPSEGGSGAPPEGGSEAPPEGGSEAPPEAPPQGHPKALGSKEEGRRKKNGGTDSSSTSAGASARDVAPWGEAWAVELTGADAATLAQLERRLATDGAKDALNRFLAAVPRSQRPGTWLPILNGYLDGLGSPRMAGILPSQLALAMLEFLVKGWDFNPNSFGAFVSDVWRREEVETQRLQERLARSAGAAGSGGATSRPIGEIRERARKAWALIKEHGFASCHPQFVAGKVEQLKNAGRIADAEGFVALLEALNPQRQALASARTEEFAIRIITDVLAELPEAAHAA